MNPRTNVFAAFLAGLLVAACGGSTAARGTANMQTDTAARSAEDAPTPSLECKGADHRCGGDDECCSNFCVDQRCTAPR
jgi:hypothetical protein